MASLEGGRSTGREGRTPRRDRSARSAGRVRRRRRERGPQCCGAGSHGSNGYAYAGHQAKVKGHGVRARISLLTRPEVEAGHAAAWIGVGGPDSGPNGEDDGSRSASRRSQPRSDAVRRDHPARRGPEFVPLEDSVPVGATRYLAVLEMNKQPGYWRVWVDGNPVTAPILLPGSSGRWQPIATAESWNGGQAICNRFAFRFERVGVAGWRGGSWHQFRPGIASSTAATRCGNCGPARVGRAPWRLIRSGRSPSRPSRPRRRRGSARPLLASRA